MIDKKKERSRRAQRPASCAVYIVGIGDIILAGVSVNRRHRRASAYRGGGNERDVVMDNRIIDNRDRQTSVAATKAMRIVASIA